MTRPRPRVLVVSPFDPWPAVDGGRLRVCAVIDRLAEVADLDVVVVGGRDRTEGGHRVVAVPPRRPLVALAAALAAGRSMNVSRLPVRRLRRTVARLAASADLVLAEYTQVATAIGSPGPPVVIDAHNVEHELAESLARVGGSWRYRRYARTEAARRRREEARAAKRASAVVTTSAADAAAFAALGARRTVVAPNGIEIARYATRDATRDAAGHGTAEGPNLVFVGKMDYRPNADAAAWFVGEVLPVVRRSVPEVTFTVVGAWSPPPASAGDPAVIVTGVVPDTRPYLDRATVVVVPVRSGSGTRLKVLEALAAGKAVVSTSKGCEGLGVEHDRHLVVADGVVPFASAVVALLGDADRRRALGAAGASFVAERFDWSRTLVPLAEVVVSTAAVATGRSSAPWVGAPGR